MAQVVGQVGGENGISDHVVDFSYNLDFAISQDGFSSAPSPGDCCSGVIARMYHLCSPGFSRRFYQ